MSIFDDVIKTATQEDRQVIDKYPQLKQAVENLEREYAVANDKLGRWEAWRAANWDDAAEATRQTVEYKKKLEDAQRQIEGLAAGAGTDMTFEEMEVNLKQKGYATTKDLDTFLKQNLASAEPTSLADKQTLRRAVDTLSLGFENIYDATADLGLKHYIEFGEPGFSRKGLFKYMDENHIQDPMLAYDRMVSSRREEIAKQKAEKQQKEVEDRVAAARKEGEDSVRKEVAMRPNGKLPTDQGEQNLGPLQAKLARERNKESAGSDADVGEYKLGQGIAAQKGFEELQKARLGSVQ